MLAFTSGTTGEPKGVMHPAASLHAMIDDLVEHSGFGHGLTSLVISPIGHMTGFLWGVLMPLRGAGDVVMLPMWEPERALDLIAQYSVGIAMGATPFLNDLLDAARERPDSSVAEDLHLRGRADTPFVDQTGRAGARLASGLRVGDERVPDRDRYGRGGRSRSGQHERRPPMRQSRRDDR